MTSESSRRLDLGTRILTEYAKVSNVVSTAITGSAAEGIADEHSDLDMTVYYTTLATDDALHEARSRAGSSQRIWSLGNPADGEFLEAFYLDDVECQIGHVTVSRWEDEIARTLAGQDPGSPLHKAMSGTLVSIPVTGAEHLSRWQARLRDYPDALALAMVRHHLTFFPIWGVVNRLFTRDAQLWARQTLVESSFNILGVLAGLNRKFFTTFQFKRARRFVDDLKLAPPDLADRLDALWTVDPRVAAQQLKELVAQTVALVEQHLPEIDTTAARKALARTR